ncbi:thioredoxin family protein [Actinomadura sp. 1N219]|uniref:thioredoxin family protein n=1 Tax=Actinomadura sp. 1N219 TaxID=3375152 RepID=UPI0037B2CA7C
MAIVLLAATACGMVEARSGSERADVVPTTAPDPEFPATPLAPMPRAYDPKGEAGAEIAAAFAKAKADGLPLLLDFGARWCAECAVLQRAFRHRAVRPLLANYHVVTIDVGRMDRHLELARKYGLELRKTGIPALIVLSPNGKVRTAGNEGLYPASANGELRHENVAAFLRRWR